VIGKIRALKKNEGTLSTVRAQRRHSLIDFPQQQPNRCIKAPASVDHRFFNEDVPYGLVTLSELGRLAGVAMPACHAVIALASIAAGQHCEKEGLTLGMGIAGLTAAELQTLLACGYD
jgi:opine dehydrogenase